MQTDLLRTFATVADLRSFTRAGEVLGRTQPAISLQIRRLETMLQAPLFERNAGPIRLSPAGETLATYARQILCLHDEAVSRLLKPVLTGSVRVGIPNDYAVSLLPTVLADFMAATPGVMLDVACDISATLLRGLQDGRHDIVVATTKDDAGAPAAKLWADRLVWVAGPGATVDCRHPLPLVVFPDGCVYRARMTDALSRAGIAWYIACTTSSLGSLQAAVHAGLGVTALSVNTAPPNLVAIAPDRGLPGLADALSGLYYGRQALSAPAQRLINFVIARLDKAQADRHPASLG